MIKLPPTYMIFLNFLHLKIMNFENSKITDWKDLQNYEVVNYNVRSFKFLTKYIEINDSKYYGYFVKKSDKSNNAMCFHFKNDSGLVFSLEYILHREGDLPSVEHIDGGISYYRDGKLYRDGDLPAIIQGNGSKFYFKDNDLHRDGDLPAIEFCNGDKHYYKNGKKHRDHGLAAVEYANYL